MAAVGTTRPLGELLDRRQRSLLVASLMLPMFMSALDQTIVSTATPRIVSDLGGFELLSWVFTGYMLASTVSVPIVGKLSDLYGRKPFLLAGIALFTAASAACGTAPSMEALIVFRAVQGIGGGLTTASVFSTLGDIFTPAERGKYTGLFTAAYSLAAILGPTVGGLLTDNVGWRWIFYINVPFVAIALPAISKNLPTVRRGVRPRLDILGVVLLCAWTLQLLLALAWAGDEKGWGSPLTLGLIASGAVCLALFLLQERRHPEPIVPLELFANRTFAIMTATVVLFACILGAVLYLPTFVQTSLGESATASGLVTTPQALGVLFASVVGGQVIARTGRYRWAVMTGTVTGTAAALLLSTAGVGTPPWHITLFMVVIGLGFGFVFPVSQVVVQNAVPYAQLGVSTSTRQFAFQIGTVVGTAAFGVLLATSYHSAFIDELPPQARAEIPAATLAKFDDPTLALDKQAYDEASASIRALPGGDQLLVATAKAQRDGVATATRDIWLACVGLAATALGLSLFLRGLPLRQSFAGSVETELAFGPE